MNTSHRGCSHPSKLILNDKTVNDPKNIAAAFNKYFATIRSKLSHAILTINIEPETFLGPALTNCFSIFPVTAIEIVVFNEWEIHKSWFLCCF